MTVSWFGYLFKDLFFFFSQVHFSFFFLSSGAFLSLNAPARQYLQMTTTDPGQKIGLTLRWAPKKGYDTGALALEHQKKKAKEREQGQKKDPVT